MVTTLFLPSALSLLVLCCASNPPSSSFYVHRPVQKSYPVVVPTHGESRNDQSIDSSSNAQHLYGFVLAPDSDKTFVPIGAAVNVSIHPHPAIPDSILNNDLETGFIAFPEINSNHYDDGYQQDRPHHHNDHHNDHHQSSCEICQPLAYCAAFYNEEYNQLAPCDLHGGGKGYCCPVIKRLRQVAEPIPSLVPKHSSLPFGPNDINIAREDAELEAQRVSAQEERLIRRNRYVQRGSPSFGHGLFFRQGRRSSSISRRAHRFLSATRGLRSRYSLNRDQAGFGLLSVSAYNTSLADLCMERPNCDYSSKYRTIDGSCNNPHVPNLGQTGTAFQRILIPRYADGVSTPRISVDGSALPSARAVSVLLAPDRNRPSPYFTSSLMNYGQFIDHDLTQAAMTTIETTNGQFGIECCEVDGSSSLTGDDLHPGCFPITIPINDPFYAKFNQRCMNFVRSAPGLRGDCRNFGFIDQMNQLTHWVDSSMIYGSTQETATFLRLGRGGLLRANFAPQQPEILPDEDQSQETPLSCTDRAAGIQCFAAGDNRVNEQPGLVVKHTIFLREHNRIAEELSHLNPHWDDEIIYQETRRIIGAMVQHITYNEWLPPLLGFPFVERTGLLPLSKGHSRDYRADIDATVTNEFAGAAFRLHTLVQDTMKLLDEHRNVVGDIKFRHVLNNPTVTLRPGVLDSMIRGLATQRQECFDNYFTKELSNHLFEGNQTFGLDLIAINIQRGRDHGLPGYNEWRPACGLKRAKTFNDLTDVMSAKAANALAQVYRHPDDVDTYIAITLEKPVDGGILGPTSQCIIGDTFLRLKRGDRFWYELGGLPHSFSSDQLNEIRKASMARLMCDNSAGVKSIQPLVFWRPHESSNPIVDCHGSEIPRMSLKPWKGEPVPTSSYPVHEQNTFGNLVFPFKKK